MFISHQRLGRKQLPPDGGDCRRACDLLLSCLRCIAQRAGGFFFDVVVESAHCSYTTQRPADSHCVGVLRDMDDMPMPGPTFSHCSRCGVCIVNGGSVAKTSRQDAASLGYEQEARQHKSGYDKFFFHSVVNKLFDKQPRISGSTHSSSSWGRSDLLGAVASPFPNCILHTVLNAAVWRLMHVSRMLRGLLKKEAAATGVCQEREGA